MNKLEKKRELLLRRKQLLEQKKQQQQQQSQVPEKSSIGETALKHGVDGATFGFSDNIAGGVRKALDFIAGDASPYAQDRKLREQGFTGDLSTDAYEEGKQSQRDDLERTGKDNPITANVANIAGAVGSGIAGAGALGATGKAGLGALAGEGALQSVGQSDADLDSKEALVNAGIGGTLGVVGPGVINVAGKIIKKAAPSFSGTIYRALKRKAGGKQPEKVKEGIKRLEDRFNLFTNTKGVTINPETVNTSLDTLYSNVNSKLNILTNKMAENIKPDKLKGQFNPLVKSLENMYNKVSKNTSNVELGNKLGKSINLMKGAIDDGDYGRLVKIMNDEIKENYVAYNALGEANVPKAIRGEMKQFLSQFNDSNSRIISSTLGEDSGKLFKNSMEDLAAYHKVKDFVSKNVGQEVKNPTPTMLDFVGAGYLGYMTNQVIAAGYLAGSTILRQPTVQGYMAKKYRQIPRSLEGTKEILSSPVAPFIKQQLPEEVGQLVNKMEAGVQLPKLHQHLVVKSLTSMFPEFYEYSEYNSLVDGKLTDPYEVNLEKRKIMEDDSISNTEKFKRTNALNKDGTMITNPNTAKGTVKPLDRDEMVQIKGFLDNVSN